MLKVSADDLLVTCILFNFFNQSVNFDQHSRSLRNHVLPYVQALTTPTTSVSSYHIPLARKLPQYLHILLEALV